MSGSADSAEGLGDGLGIGPVLTLGVLVQAAGLWAGAHNSSLSMGLFFPSVDSSKATEVGDNVESDDLA